MYIKKLQRADSSGKLDVYSQPPHRGVVANPSISVHDSKTLIITKDLAARVFIENLIFSLHCEKNFATISSLKTVENCLVEPQNL